MALASPASRRRVAPFPTEMTLFILSLLLLSAAAVLVTVRAVGQARDGFEEATGFRGEPTPVARQAQAAGDRPAMGVRPVGFAS